jgi:cell division protein FtsI/penicillin-binding protein 2
MGATRKKSSTGSKKKTTTASVNKSKTSTRKTVSAKSRSGRKSTVVKASAKGKRSTRRSRRSRYANRAVPGARVAHGPWTSPTFADSTAGDSVDGEDLTVRRAAVEALGPYNGAMVVVDPNTGHILTMVNQKVAMGEAYTPCSTVKVLTAVAGLSEGAITRDDYVRVYRRTSMNLTSALAMSNNPYFATIGTRLGYERVSHYGRLFGYGEKAGLNIAGESSGVWPAVPPKNGGMGMMTSFGEGIFQTPLQLAAIMSAVANGGTLYYLQYPKNQYEAEHMVPRVKRHLPIRHLIDDIGPGLSGAVDFGTARRAAYYSDEEISGKTGTCTDTRTPTHLGWFGGYNEVNGRKLAVVVLLTGGRPINGPVASGVAGQFFRQLGASNYFATKPVSPVALVNGSSW